ncbi:acetate kinase [Ruminococcaceae bacterium OttesenSCG-928-D13]|nr:acetate kinase [Ruminococcaceae bacterium OttesenSCG-928-D13]
MKILVINCGSSSLKYQLIDMDTEAVMCKGLCERIGIDGGTVVHKANGNAWEITIDMPTHAEAFAKMLDLMTEGEGAVLKDKAEINAIGHRVVHGGEKFKDSVVISEEVISTIDELSSLAPLHNPPQVVGIRSAQKVFGMDVPQVAVFDTAFHQTMPPTAYIYPVPYEYYEKHSVRRYGFHGTSHKYVSRQAAKFLGKDVEDLKIVTCHLGNGSSMCAVDKGKSIDTTMGLTPLAGILMGTRCGDIDPSVVTYIQDVDNLSSKEVNDLLNKKSGMLGVSGLSSDNRDIEKAAIAGHERAALVHSMLFYEIKKNIGAYSAAMNGLDCVVFTGGIGENSRRVRKYTCRGLEYCGLLYDDEKNQKGSGEFDFATDESRVRALVIPTNEELMIARDTLTLTTAGKAADVESID